MKKNALLTLVPLIALGFGLIFPKLATAGHGYVSIPAAAFQPETSTAQYNNFGYYLHNAYDNDQFYSAPVQLPHGVTVTKLTFYFFDNSSAVGDWGSVTLGRSNNNVSIPSNMAYAVTNNSGNSSTYDDSIDFASIDNSQYSYILYLDLHSSVVWAYTVVIEYTNPVSLPLILK